MGMCLFGGQERDTMCWDWLFGVGVIQEVGVVVVHGDLSWAYNVAYP